MKENLTHQNIEDQLILLTAQREIGKLNETLISILADLAAPHSFALLQKDDAFDSTLKLTASKVSENFPILDLCLLSEEQLFEQISSNRLLWLPYSIVDTPSGGILSDLPEQHPLRHKVEKLISVFANQLFFMFSATHDSLTGLQNRHAFDHAMQDSVFNNQRRQQPQSESCFAILDIDHFKQVNDSFGHLFGDEVLLLFARVMQKSFRSKDMLFRYGGEEFAVVLHNASCETAIKVLERFRETVASTLFPKVGQVTVSIGATMMEDHLSLPQLIDRADQALYFAKEHGRNQTHTFETLSAQGHLSDIVLSNDDSDIELF